MDIITDPIRNLLATIAHWLPQFLGALIVLLVGYIVARAIEGIFKRVLHRTKFDDFLKRGTAGSYIGRVISSPAALLASVVFWLLWLTALSIAVTILGVPALTNFVNVVYGYLPNVLAALLIFIVAGAISTALASLVLKLMGNTPTGKLVGTVVPVLTMLIATFMILSQLQIAHDIVVITYAALMGGVALAMALAFGLGGRTVASQLLDQAYESGKSGVQQARLDMSQGKARAKQEVRERGL